MIIALSCAVSFATVFPVRIKFARSFIGASISKDAEPDWEIVGFAPPKSSVVPEIVSTGPVPGVPLVPWKLS